MVNNFPWNNRKNVVFRLNLRNEDFDEFARFEVSESKKHIFSGSSGVCVCVLSILKTNHRKTLNLILYICIIR